MRRLFWVAVGAAAAVATVHKARAVVDEHVPAGARSALGAAASLSTAVGRARAEFRAGTAQREAELRAALLAGADLTRSRQTVDAWRTQRAERSAGPDGDGDGAEPLRPAGRPGGGSHRAEDPEDGPEGYSF